MRSIPSNKLAVLASATALTVAGLVYAPASTAATATTTLGVAAVVLQTCIAAATPVVFGNYTLTALDNTGIITVTCTPDVLTYNVALGAGNGAGATTSTRKLTSVLDSSTLNYSLYRDSARTQNWGSVQNTDTVASTAATTDLGTIKTFTVYGRLPESQTGTVGAYADIVQVTVNY